jgi:hypothetical protein
MIHSSIDLLGGNMRKHFIRVLLLVLALPILAAAQSAQLKLDLGNLASKAKESVNISIDRTTVDWASQALKSKGGDTEKMRELMKDLEGITVQVLEFEKNEKAPSVEELVAAARGVIKELDGPQWKSIINVTEKHEKRTELVRISLWKDAAGKIGGLALLAIEPGEIALISVVGNVKLDQLETIGKAIGHPGMFGPLGGAVSSQPKQ